jgi:glycerophosphoryl diester phosphodiesterase
VNTVAPQVYAHRLGSEYGPESSLAALERTLGGKVDGLEVDVVMTSDREVFACHDPLLQISTAELTGWAHQREAAALSDAHLLDGNGEPSDQRMATLREGLQAIPPDLTVQLDVKTYGDWDLARLTAERCCEIAAELGRSEQIELVSFFTSACEAAVERGVRCRLIAWADYAPSVLVSWARERGIGGLSYEGFILSRSLREAAREAGLTISVGAVNSQEQLELLLPLEPEIIVSDDPHTIRAAIDDWNAGPLGAAAG